MDLNGSALPQRAGTPMRIVEVAHVAASHRLHHLGQPLGSLGCGQQMEMVIHQDVGVDRHLETSWAFSVQQVQHEL